MQHPGSGHSIAVPAKRVSRLPLPGLNEGKDSRDETLSGKPGMHANINAGGYRSGSGCESVLP
jgi:hypothetical protein